MGRVIAITGAFGVLGSAVAKMACAGGSKCALIDYAWAVPANCPGEALVLGGVDLTDPEKAAGAIKTVVDKLGRLDALLNIAGGFKWETFEDGTHQSWSDLYRLNVVTAANASRAAIPYLKRSPAGRIVNVGSAAALKAGHGMGAYAASKSGVHSLTQALAEELKGTNVTVNAVLPSIIDTPANRADMPKADFVKWVKTEQLADVIVFLLSGKSQAITGALLPVTGRV